jgi:hypothetical protein
MVGEAGGATGGRLRMTRPHRAGRIEHQDPAADQVRKPSRDSGRPTADGRPGELLLAAKALGHARVVLLGQQVRHRLADRDERRRAIHFEQRQVVPAGAGHQGLRHPVVPNPDAETQADHADVEQPTHIAFGGRLAPAERDAGGQQQLAAEQKRRRVLELTRRHPSDRNVEPLTRQQPEAERPIGEQGTHGGTHLVHSVQVKLRSTPFRGQPSAG